MEYTTLKLILMLVGFTAGMEIGGCAQNLLIQDKIDLACAIQEL